MNKDDIKLTDWLRIIMGDSPAMFLIEIIFRVVLIYAILLIGMRLMGNRMAASITRIEQASIVTLAAAIGVPIQTPERGILPAFIIALVVVLCGKIIASKSVKSERFERIAQGKIDTLISNGVLQMEVIRNTSLTPERIFAQLRNKGIICLSQVKRFYIEANGSFTLLKAKEERPGLMILPEYDHAFRKEFKESDEEICASCGAVREVKGQDKCRNCNHDVWIHGWYAQIKNNTEQHL
jgi:uncharacterized membrane protein YcaP (DUF421 family)